jgi:hypothetical protein
MYCDKKRLVFGTPPYETSGLTEPACGEVQRVVAMPARILRFLIGCFLVSALLACVLVMLYGSVRAGLARLRGDELVLIPDQIDVANLAKASDEKVGGHFTVKNLCSRSIIVSGAHVGCSCVEVTSELPFSLAPGEQKDVAFTLEPPSDGSAVSQTVTFYADSSADPQLFAVISGAARK